MLAGIVVNNAIVLIDYINVSQRLAELERRIGKIEAAARGDIPPSADELHYGDNELG